MRALGSIPRAILAASAFGAFAGAFAGVPLGARGAAGVVPSSPLSLAVRRLAPLAVVLPRRDPFADTGPVVRVTAPALPARPGAAVPIPAALVPLPPNAGAGTSPFPLAGEGIRVRAVITGATPFALVDDAGATRLVTLGDGVAGDTIAAITADGVRLAHGRAIGVAHAAAAAQAGSGGYAP